MALSAPLSAREPRYMNHEFGGTLQSAGAQTVQVMPGGAGIPHRPKNPLLVRDDVGKAKPSCYDLPQDHFAYGRPGHADVEGAREVSMRWVSHTPSGPPEATAPDYLHFNRKATTAKISNAKDLKHYRKEHDVVAMTPRSTGLDRPITNTERMKLDLEGVLPPGFAHGRKVRPSTPIGEVISNRFGERAEQDLYRFYTDFRNVQDAARTTVRKIPLTNASRGHASTAKKALLQQDDQKELFKLTKFKNRAVSKIDNRRRRGPSHDIAADVQYVSDFGDDDRFLPHGGERLNDSSEEFGGDASGDIAFTNV